VCAISSNRYFASKCIMMRSAARLPGYVRNRWGSLQRPKSLAGLSVRNKNGRKERKLSE